MSNISEVCTTIPSGSGLGICEHCGKVMSKSSIFTHVLSVHLKKREFVCSTCEARFATKYKLKFHQHKHSTVRNFFCSIDGKAFKTKSDLIQHQKTHEIGPFTCSFCFLTISKRKEFDRHVKGCVLKPSATEVKDKRPIKKREYSCDICFKIFSKSCHLKRHKACIHENKRNFKCDFEGCDKAFNDITDLGKHKKIVHLRFRGAQCHLCNAEYPFKSSLLKHMKIAHEEFGTKFSCDLCKRTFILKETIKRHMRSVHLKIRKTENRIPLKRKTQFLVTHLEVPTQPNEIFEDLKLEVDPLIEIKEEVESEGESCDRLKKEVNDEEESLGCDELNFQDSDSEKSLESASLENQENVSFPCKKCNKILYQKSQLHYHEKFAHEEKQESICTIDDCSRVFAYPSSLKRHQTIDHGISATRKIQCQNCEKFLSNKCSLTRHSRYACPKREVLNNEETENDLEDLKAQKQPTEPRKFKCNLCDKTFSRRREYECHKNYVHEGKKDFICTYDKCGKMFAHERSLKYHTAKNHGTESMEASCENCGRTFSDKDGLRKHQREIHEGIRFSCTQCEKSFCRRTLLNRHIDSIHNHKKYVCDFEGCRKIFNHEAAMKQHKVRNHEKRSSCFCPICKEGFFCRRDVKKHLSQVHDNGRLKMRKCGFCGMKFQNYQEFYDHILTHQGYHICKLCGKSFETEPLYQVHLVQHRNWKHSSNSERFVCDLCDMKYLNKSTLIVHMRKHLNIYPFICDTCGSSFRSQAHFWMHQSKHGKSRYTCGYCQKGFVSKNSFEIHIRIHTNDKPFECHICFKKFAGKQPFQIHMDFHAQKFKCTNCNKNFSGPQWLKAHSSKCSVSLPSKISSISSSESQLMKLNETNLT